MPHHLPMPPGTTPTRRTWLLAAGVVSLLTASVFLVRVGLRPHLAVPGAPAASASDDVSPPLAHVDTVVRDEDTGPEAPPVAGLDLLDIAFDDSGAAAPSAEGTARLTIDPELQRAASAMMASHHLPEAAIVLMDVATGKLLVYASHVDKGPARDLCAEASAPSASVFKIVTAAALVEDAHLGPDTKQCYSGGEQRITLADLTDDPERDRWCVTLSGALGRSVNAVFARLAKGHLAPAQLETMARRFGYGQSPSFDVPVQPSALHVPAEPLEFARTAAGFWNTTLSPVQAVELSAVVARGGETVRPRIVDEVRAESGAVRAMPEPGRGKRAIAAATAEDLTAMMERTVSEGTSFRTFHDGKGTSFLPGVVVAGKTGTLTDAETQRYYTWFTGFAPVRPMAGVRQVAISVLVVNGPTWQVKANGIARDTLRAYFAEAGVQGVTRPTATSVARHHKER